MMTQTTAGDVLAVTDQTFEQEVLSNDAPVLVEFWVEWCPPCHMLAPILDDIARERAGSLVVRKLNNDENPITASTYQVLSLPTLMLFRDGQPVHVSIGARPKRRLLSELDSALHE